MLMGPHPHSLSLALRARSGRRRSARLCYWRLSFITMPRGPHPHGLCLRGSRRSALLLATIIYHYAVGPHPHGLCLRGSRRSALLLATIRLVNVNVERCVSSDDRSSSRTSTLRGTARGVTDVPPADPSHRCP